MTRISDGQPVPDDAPLPIGSVTAFIALDPDDNTEGILTSRLGRTEMPLIAADSERAASLLPFAAASARDMGIKASLIRFSSREVLIDDVRDPSAHWHPTPPPGIIDAAHIERQRAWSRETFGPGTRLQGVLDHIHRELDEVEESPGDVEEWADLVILAFDGAWRSGHEPQQIIDAVLAKQAKNEAREWPDWTTQPYDRAIEHLRGDR